MNKGMIWVVDDDRSIRWVLEKALLNAGQQVETFASAEGILNKLATSRPDVIVSDVRMPGLDGMQLLAHLQERYSGIPVIIMTAFSDLDSTVTAYEGGAFEYLPKPFDVDEAVSIVDRAVQHSREESSEQERAVDLSLSNEIVGTAPAMQEVFRAIGRLARSNMTVLITGQSGTGKELVAQALHRHSPRAEQPFIALNTAAIPKDLLESELFGHERGAFTGAQSQRRGRFEQADDGTLFLDEIGDMPAELQTRLLRVLADGEFFRVGGHTPIRVNVRVIAATHQDLENRVAEGVFREDLFHRLNVIRVHIPSLRERREDIPVLTRYFLDSAARELEVEPKQLRQDAQEYMRGLDWPGNVRQLENTCRWLTVMASGKEIHVEDLPPELRSQEAEISREPGWEKELERWADQHLAAGQQNLLGDAVPRFERIMIESALRKTGGRRQEAARLLGWGRNTLTRKIKELGMENGEEQALADGEPA